MTKIRGFSLFQGRGVRHPMLHGIATIVCSSMRYNKPASCIFKWHTYFITLTVKPVRSQNHFIDWTSNGNSTFREHDSVDLSWSAYSNYFGLYKFRKCWILTWLKLEFVMLSHWTEMVFLTINDTFLNTVRYQTTSVGFNILLAQHDAGIKNVLPEETNSSPF